MHALLERIQKLVVEYERDRFRWIHIHIDDAKSILAHIERLESPQIPEGCVVVPREPTRGMLDIMEAVDEDGYREMYVAAINHYENHRHE